MISRIPARMDEHEAFTNLIEGCKMAEAACRQLAYMRSDAGHASINATNKAKMWILAAQQFATLRDKCTQIALAKIAS